MSDLRDSILVANAAFYDAHENRDLEAMAAVWEHSERACCTHPGWPILRGWPLIEESWRRIFAGSGRNQFIVTNLAVTVVGDVAWATLDENLVDHAMTGTVAATNVFVRVATSPDESDASDAPGAWKLVVHHGSPVASAGN